MVLHKGWWKGEQGGVEGEMGVSHGVQFVRTFCEGRSCIGRSRRQDLKLVFHNLSKGLGCCNCCLPALTEEGGCGWNAPSSPCFEIMGGFLIFVFGYLSTFAWVFGYSWLGIMYTVNFASHVRHQRWCKRICLILV